MYSIQNQKRDTIYYNPNIKKLYVIESSVGEIFRQSGSTRSYE